MQMPGSPPFDSTFAALVKRRRGTPFMFEEALIFHADVNKAILHIRSDMDKLRFEVLQQSGFVPDNFVQQSIDALERGAGDRVEIVTDIIIDRESLETQLGEGDCNLILQSSATHENELPDAINYRGVQGYVINRDVNRVLIRTNTTVPVLLWVRNNEISPIPDGCVKGLIDSSPMLEGEM